MVAMQFHPSRFSPLRLTLIALILVMHLFVLLTLSRSHGAGLLTPALHKALQIYYVKNRVAQHALHPVQKLEEPVKKKPQPQFQTTSKSPSISLVPAEKAHDDLAEKESVPVPAINRNIKAITQVMEKELATEKEIEKRNKPANQIVREYWEAQNHPYKDKWDKLAHKIEEAGVPRGDVIETYTLNDGTRITKKNGKCYKAPDPGREYLHQAEIRQVFCTR